MAILIAAAVGAFLGPALFGGVFGNILAGAALGALAGWLFTLQRRLRRIEAEAGRSEPPMTLADEPVGHPTSEPAAGAPDTATADWSEPVPEPAGIAEPDAEFEPAPESPQPAADPSVAPSWAREAAGTESLEPSIAERLFEHARRWLTSGNVPVKVGVVLSLIGVGFLVRVAVDRNWIALPIELRLIGVALFGLALLGLGWRLRTARPGYALSLQGGGVAIVYLTIYAAFAFYDLLPPVLAFALLVVVTAAAGALAVVQNSRELAVLGIVGGFLAPVLASSDVGDHVVLFSYYALLNAAVLAIAWFRAWRELNVLSFLFTFGVGAYWGYTSYAPALFASTEPFLVLFVAMYIAIPVLFATRAAPRLRGFVDGTLVFGTPFVGFGLQAGLVGDIEYGLATSAATLAGVYGALGMWMLHRGSAELRVLAEAFLSLGVVFLTIAFPLALDPRWTSAAWSLQGAAMIWLGYRQSRRLALIGGTVLQIASAVAFFNQEVAARDLAVFNGDFLGALWIAVAALISSRIFDRIRESDDRQHHAIATWALLVWGTVWWLGGGLNEIVRFVPDRFQLDSALLFVAGTVWAAVLAARTHGWQRVATLGCLMAPAIGVALLIALFARQHALEYYGWPVWLVAFGTHFGFLRLQESQLGRVASVLHTGGYWLIAALAATEVHWWVERWTDGVWATAATIAVVAALLLATVRARDVLDWPLRVHWRTYGLAAVGATLVVLAVATIRTNIVSPGDPDPLPYVPLLNPLELASGLVFAAGWFWYAAVREWVEMDRFASRWRVLVPAVLGLFLLTMTVARSVHHWADVRYALEPLAESTVLQASLSIVWGSSALAGMVAGARAANRAIWIAGAVLMAIVVVKLFVVELDNAGTVGRVVSFLGVGVLLLIVGYFAPVPPRAEPRAAAAP